MIDKCSRLTREALRRMRMLTDGVVAEKGKSIEERGERQINVATRMFLMHHWSFVSKPSTQEGKKEEDSSQSADCYRIMRLILVVQYGGASIAVL